MSGPDAVGRDPVEPASYEVVWLNLFRSLPEQFLPTGDWDFMRTNGIYGYVSGVPEGYQLLPLAVQAPYQPEFVDGIEPIECTSRNGSIWRVERPRWLAAPRGYHVQIKAERLGDAPLPNAVLLSAVLMRNEPLRHRRL